MRSSHRICYENFDNTMTYLLGRRSNRGSYGPPEIFYGLLMYDSKRTNRCTCDPLEIHALYSSCFTRPCLREFATHLLSQMLDVCFDSIVSDE